ncbi:MAG: hypothetical protein M3220_19085 [Chloroflexota bacterium]|nr:hypothetical protein [Chloroflexota bacterium]
MEDWSDWIVEDSDPAEMIRQMRTVLADRKRSHEEKIEALTLLTNLADDASIAVLRWYSEHADPGMEVPSMLALIEADRLNRPPSFEPWHEELLEKIHQVSEELSTRSISPDRREFRETLVRTLREDHWQVEEGGQALLKYDGQLVDMVPVELVVNGQVMIGFWDRTDEEEAWAAVEFEEEIIDPFDRFYAALRTANLPWGIQVDISSHGILTDIVQNMELDRGRPKVEYILSMPHNH